MCFPVYRLELMFLPADVILDNITTWYLYHTLHFSKYFSLIWFSLQPWEVSRNRYYLSYFTNEKIQSGRWWLEGITYSRAKTKSGSPGLFTIPARLTRAHVPRSLIDCQDFMTSLPATLLILWGKGNFIPSLLLMQDIWQYVL